MTTENQPAEFFLVHAESEYKGEYDVDIIGLFTSYDDAFDSAINLTKGDKNGQPHYEITHDNRILNLRYRIDEGYSNLDDVDQGEITYEEIVITKVYPE